MTTDESAADEETTDRPGIEGAVGDGRPKYVEVVTADGQRHEHGDSYLRQSETAFVVSSDPEFPEEETVVYEKASLRRVSVEQHHSACFVTTAVAGEERTLAALRRFRDDALLASPPGRLLVALYERVSPPVADTLAAQPRATTARIVRRLVRTCAGLARRRERSGTPVSTALSLVLVVLYLVGVAVAAAGHAAAQLKKRRTLSRGR